jgi:FKBP-type peptidyl-prolyl cis-trans isomerase SlyD
MFVELRYQVKDVEGESVGPDDEQLGFVFGMGQLLPVVERAIDGLVAGDTRLLKLGSLDAYGPRDPDAVLEVERGEFPPDVQAGDYFEVENADEGLLVLRVLEVTEDCVLVDLNHPLAGQDLQVTVAVLSVRPASQEEQELAMKTGLEGDDEDAPPLIAPESLLRGPKRR